MNQERVIPIVQIEHVVTALKNAFEGDNRSDPVESWAEALYTFADGRVMLNPSKEYDEVNIRMEVGRGTKEIGCLFSPRFTKITIYEEGRPISTSRLPKGFRLSGLDTLPDGQEELVFANATEDQVLIIIKGVDGWISTESTIA